MTTLDRSEAGTTAAAQTGDAEDSGKFGALAMPFITLLCLVALWELLVRIFDIPGWLLPAPSAIGRIAFEWRGDLAWHSAVTLYETLVGFGLSLVVGIPLAVAVVYSR